MEETQALGAHVVVFTTSLNKVEDALRLADDVVHSKDEAAMKKHLNSCHFILDTVAAKRQCLPCSRRDGALTRSVPAEPLAVDVSNSSLAAAISTARPSAVSRKPRGARLRGAQHHLDIDSSRFRRSTGHDRLVKSDVKYRFVIDMALLSKRVSIHRKTQPMKPRPTQKKKFGMT
jgi:uncharacterized zinc-type alcohol dehydrogenase-like protein